MTRALLFALLMLGQAVQKPAPLPTVSVSGGGLSITWPEIVSTQLILDPVQAKNVGNEGVKQCSPTNHDDACFDPKMLHIISHFYYGSSRKNCERYEGVECEELYPCMVNVPGDWERCEAWVPIGKPVFEDKTPRLSVEQGAGLYYCVEDQCVTTKELSDKTPTPSKSDQIRAECQTALASVRKLKKDHPDWNIDATCGEYFELGVEHQTKRVTALTPSEIKRLEYARAVETVAVDKADETEKEIIKEHGIAAPDDSGWCFGYVGIVYGQNFITEYVPDPDCVAKAEGDGK